MQNRKTKATILFALILIVSMSASTMLSPIASGQVYPPAGTHIPTYAYLNVAPSPVSMAKQLTSTSSSPTPMETVEYAVGMTVKVVAPDGTTKTSDLSHQT